MNKHLTGFAIFGFIVGSAFLAKAFFGLFAPQVIVAPLTVTETTVEVPAYKKSACSIKRDFNKTNAVPLNYELKNVVFNADENELTADLRITWNGTGEQPDAISYKINFFTDRLPSQDIFVAEGQIESPFSENNTLVEKVSLPVKNKRAINNLKKNYYAIAELWAVNMNQNSDSKTVNGKLTRVVPNHEERLAQAAPVTVAHEK